MPQSLSTVFVHAVFSTKDRRPFLRPEALRAEMHAYLGGVSGRLDSPTEIVGGTEDHVHVLFRLGRTISQADWVKEVKRVSSLWVKEHEAEARGFAWQAGYGMFSVSASNLEIVRTYVLQQGQHHRARSFQDEFRSLLKKHKIEWDERYVWD